MQPAETTVGFVGTGVMGASMAGHLLDAGFRLRVHNRTKGKADDLLSRGALWAESPGAAARGADVVVTMVGYPSDVEEAYLGEGAIIESAEPGALLIDMTTSSPALATRIAAAASARGLDALDAPVSGGDVGARNATLTIMVGGDDAALERAMPVFSAMGKTILRHGGPGAGQHCKMANQIAIAASMLGLAECLAYAVGAGLDRARVLETLNGGSAQSWTLANYGPRVLAGDFQPGFYVKHFVKDLRIAIASAEGMRVELPGLALAKRLYEALANGGGSELGTQAIWLLYAQAGEREAAGVLGGVTAHSAVKQ
jgi:3-hydroxyisobutyrate dehydrogenase